MDDSFNPVVAKNDDPERHERDVSSGFGSRTSRYLTETTTSSSMISSTTSSSTRRRRSRAESRSASMTSSDESLQSGQQTYESVGAPGRNYFDVFTEGPIYYIKPEFTKPIRVPKHFPELAYDDFFVQQPVYSGKKQRSKVDNTKANENSNWVLLPAAWRPSVQADTDTVEAKNESSEAKISRFGFWVTLKPGMESLRRENSKMQN